MVVGLAGGRNEAGVALEEGVVEGRVVVNPGVLGGGHEVGFAHFGLFEHGG